MKTCPRCSVEKGLTEFPIDARYAGGRTTWCAACHKDYQVQHHIKNKDRDNAREAARYAANRERVRAKHKAYYEANKEAHAARVKAVRKRNPERYRLRSNECARRRRACSVEARLRSRISAQINYCLKTGKGGATTKELLGYSIQDLKKHLEAKFSAGMSWSNIGQWHIDHVRPLASFHITGVTDPALRAAWSLDNLQPLWARENIVKGSLWNGRRHQHAA